MFSWSFSTLALCDHHRFRLLLTLTLTLISGSDHGHGHPIHSSSQTASSERRKNKFIEWSMKNIGIFDPYFAVILTSLCHFLDGTKVNSGCETRESYWTIVKGVTYTLLRTSDVTTVVSVTLVLFRAVAQCFLMASMCTGATA